MPKIVNAEAQSRQDARVWPLEEEVARVHCLVGGGGHGEARRMGWFHLAPLRLGGLALILNCMDWVLGGRGG